MRMHSRIGIVVLEGTAFMTILTLFKRLDFENTSFIWYSSFLVSMNKVIHRKRIPAGAYKKNKRKRKSVVVFFIGVNL